MTLARRDFGAANAALFPEASKGSQAFARVLAAVTVLDDQRKAHLLALAEARRIVDVVLSFHDIVVPDLIFIAGDQTGIMTEKNIQGAPALVVEVLSKSTRKRDVQIKRRLFEQVGVREYWLVDPELDTVQVLQLTAEGRLVRVEELTAEDGGTLATPLLPGCAIDVRLPFRPTL